MATDKTTGDPVKVDEKRKYLIGAMNPGRAPRLAPTLLAMREALSRAGEEGLARPDLVLVGLRASDLQRNTVLNLMSTLRLAGFMTRTRPAPRQQRFFIDDWPTP